jgi:hypothetical protein
MLAWDSIARAMPSALYALIIFEIGFWFLLGLA